MIQEFPTHTRSLSPQFNNSSAYHELQSPLMQSRQQTRLRFLHVGRVIVSSRSVAATQNIRNLNSRAERSSKRRSVVVRGTITRVVVHGKSNTVRVGLGGGPLGPAGRVDDIANGGLLENDVGVLTPGAAEVVGAGGDGGARVGGDVAVVEDVLALARGGSTVGYGGLRVSICPLKRDYS